MSKQKWIFSIAAWLTVFSILLIYVYFNEKNNIDAKSSQYLGLKISEEASIGDIFESAGFHFFNVLTLLFLLIFIPLVLSIIQYGKLTEESNSGWRRIYFLFPIITSLTAAFEAFNLNNLTIPLLIYRITIFSIPAMALGLAISIGLMWIKDGFEKK